MHIETFILLFARMGATALFHVLCVVLLTYMFSGVLFWFVYAFLIILFIAVGIFIAAIFITCGNGLSPFVSPKDFGSALEKQEVNSAKLKLIPKAA